MGKTEPSLEHKDSLRANEAHDQPTISRNMYRYHLAVFDVPGRIFPTFFDGPGFFVVSVVCEVSIDVPGPTAGPKAVGGKMKDVSLLPLVTLGFGPLVSAIYESVTLKGAEINTYLEDDQR